ncbi:hypothetical protein LCGC14_1367310, partial [marine sediment metagenome]
KAMQALNEMDHIEENIRYVGVKKDVLVDLFLKGVEDCPEEDEGNLPKVVVEMNNLLIDDEDSDVGEDETGKDEKDEKDKKDEKECPDFGKDHGKDKEKCGECKEEYPEDYDECKKLSPKKGSVKKKGAAKKTKTKGEKKKTGTVDYSKSNKAIIYFAWKKGQKDAKKLHALVKEAVKLGTIRNWLNGWKNGKYLPAVAKKNDK